MTASGKHSGGGSSSIRITSRQKLRRAFLCIPVFMSHPPQPRSRGQSQPSIQPPLTISAPVSTPPTTPQLPPATSPTARPHLASSSSPSLTVAATAAVTSAAATADRLPSLDSGTSLDTRYGPRARKVIVRSGQDDTVRATPRSSRPTSTRTPEGMGSAPAPTSELPPSPLWMPSTTPAEDQLPEEVSEDRSVCYEACAFPIVSFESCSHRLHLTCYAARRVRAGADLRYPACRATVTANEADRVALRQHSNGL